MRPLRAALPHSACAHTVGYRESVVNTAFKEALAIGFGASFGALARFAFTPLIAPEPPSEIVIIFVINAIGCFLMGFFDPGPFWGRGMIGGFTTFSAVSFLAMQSSAFIALVYMVSTMLVALAAWELGDALRRRRSPEVAP
nr:CrcB family protein [Corynebacterium sp. Marseille-P3884]